MKSKVVIVNAVIFDMDGVITNTMEYHYKVWREIFSFYGIKVTKYEIYRREGQRGLQSVLEIFRERNLNISKEQAQVILNKKEILLTQFVKTKFVPGSRAVVDKLHKRGFKLALVTGTSRQEVIRILPQSLLNKFHILVCGSDVRNGKPHPEPYLRALRSLKLKPYEAIVIENAPFGITSAKSAGLKCLALETSLSKKYLKQADYIFPSFKSLEKAIQFKLADK